MTLLLRASAAGLGLFAVALQYWLVARGHSGRALVAVTIGFFSFFTILTNLLAVLAMALPVVAARSAIARFLSCPPVRTAIAGYSIVVAAVYYFVLRHTWDPQGWHLADRVLHYAMPALFVADWVLVVPKGRVPWTNGFAALAFPLVYGAWTLLHGAMTGWYPYPFVDAARLGYGPVLANLAGLAAVLLALQLALVAIDRLMGRLRPRTKQAARSNEEA